MNIFETVKAAVTVRQAAEHYGLKINRSGMICCPFHDDRHPSLKLNEDYFYCFGCGAKGDVIDFVARLLDLSAYEAAQRLAADFGLDRPPSVVAQVKKYRPRVNQSKQDELFCMNVLSGYLHLLEDWKERYAPEAPEDEPDERFVEACHKLEYVEYLNDLLLMSDQEERTDILMKQKEQLAAQEQKLEELTLKIEDVETLLDDVSDAAYDKAVEVVTDTVRQETHKEDIRLVEESKKWVLSPERKAPKKEREYAAARLDGVINKIKNVMQTALAKIQRTLMQPEVKQAGKEQVKKKAKESIMDMLAKAKINADRDNRERWEREGRIAPKKKHDMEL